MSDYPLEQSIAVLEALQDCKSDQERLNVIRDALREGYEYRSVAHYMASCHAATLESLPKSASQSLRSRLISICQKAAQSLASAYYGNHPHDYHSPESRSSVVDRCLAVASKEG